MPLGTIAQKGDILYYLYGQMFSEGLSGYYVEIVLSSYQAKGNKIKRRVTIYLFKFIVTQTSRGVNVTTALKSFCNIQTTSKIKCVEQEIFTRRYFKSDRVYCRLMHKLCSYLVLF